MPQGDKIKGDERSKRSQTWPNQTPSSLEITAIFFEFIPHLVHLALIFYCLMLVGRGIHACMSYLPK